jgi:hypothetical protein
VGFRIVGEVTCDKCGSRSPVTGFLVPGIVIPEIRWDLPQGWARVDALGRVACPACVERLPVTKNRRGQ